jgi:hypothetical protein
MHVTDKNGRQVFVWRTGKERVPLKNTGTKEGIILKRILDKEIGWGS